MDWAEWSPLYAQIVREFGFSVKEDEAARDLLARLLAARASPLAGLRAFLAGRPAVVVGAGRAVDPARLPEGARIVADKAVLPFLAAGGRPDLVVTDLDGDPATLVALSALGVPAAVHAHGDNVDAVSAWVPRLSGPVLGTTQAEPVPPLVNFGGFTDGDRACFLAQALGATRLALAGFDFERAASERKLRKLAWAKRLVERLDVPVAFVE